MPQFKLVTGISTGALQATGVFIRQPEISLKGYRIEREQDILETYVDGSAIDGGFGFSAISSLLRRGAISDLIPLRDKLAEIHDHDVLLEVARRYNGGVKGSHLLVGVTDVDLGRAVALDMTELAHRYAMEPENSDESNRLKRCYISALIASSTVPPAARPAFIDNRMYLDGGVRYAIFDDRIGAMIENMQPVASASFMSDDPDGAEPAPATPSPEPGPLGFYAILNHTGDSRAECRKVDQANLCKNLDSRVGQRQDWEPIGLAVRTLELFENQVRRLSVERAQNRAELNEIPFFFARIQAEELADRQYAFEIEGAEGKKTCMEWLKDDDADENPLEFHRRYMRCLVKYGQKRGRAGDWDFQTSN